MYLAKFAMAYDQFECFVKDLVRNLGVKIARRPLGLDRWMSGLYDLIYDDDDYFHYFV